MNDRSKPPTDRGANGRALMATEPGIDRSRRRFIKGGAAGAPVILTLTSRPVFGFENACVAPSRMISGNFSGFDGPESCSGNTRQSYYDQVKGIDKEKWPPWANVKFVDVGGAGSLVAYVKGGVQHSNWKVGRVLIDSYDGNDGNMNSVPKFASYIIAAYLNAVAIDSVAAVLKPIQVVHMWNDIVSTATGFCPQISMCWNANGVIGYLENSGIVPS